MNNLLSVLVWLLEIPGTSEPEEIRRRKLLGVLIVGMGGISLSAFVATVVAYVAGFIDQRMMSRFGGGAFLGFVGLSIVFLINRFLKGYIASFLFLVSLTAISTFIDEPRQVVEGRSLFLLTIPILISSVILPPWASFIMAGTVGIVISILATLKLPDYANGVPPIPTILGFFAFAIVAWLSANSLENALRELYLINQELDQRVEERTRELAEANRELREANEKLRELDRLKSQFVSMVSHELRTPLNAIQGYAEILGAGIYGPVTPRQREILERIISNDQRLLSLVNDLLDQARMEAGQLSLHIAPLALRELVQDVESTVRMLAENKGLYLNFHMEKGLPATIQGDRKRLHQIMVNLINNAIKFTEQGGIDVRLYRPDSEHWAFEVTDTGPGIPKEAQKYIFDPFRQVDSSITREHTGFGLGLAIVKQLTALMGGSVELSSEVGQGSTFKIVLPLEPPQQGEKE